MYIYQPKRGVTDGALTVRVMTIVGEYISGGLTLCTGYQREMES